MPLTDSLPLALANLANANLLNLAQDPCPLRLDPPFLAVHVSCLPHHLLRLRYPRHRYVNYPHHMCTLGTVNI